MEDSADKAAAKLLKVNCSVAPDLPSFGGPSAHRLCLRQPPHQRDQTLSGAEKSGFEPRAPRTNSFNLSSPTMAPACLRHTRRESSTASFGCRAKAKAAPGWACQSRGKSRSRMAEELACRARRGKGRAFTWFSKRWMRRSDEGPLPARPTGPGEALAFARTPLVPDRKMPKCPTLLNTIWSVEPADSRLLSRWRQCWHVLGYPVLYRPNRSVARQTAPKLRKDYYAK